MTRAGLAAVTLGLCACSQTTERISPPTPTAASAWPPLMVRRTDQGCGYTDLAGAVVVPTRFAECAANRGVWWKSWVPVRVSAAGPWTLYDALTGAVLPVALDELFWQHMSSEHVEGRAGDRRVLLRRDGGVLPVPDGVDTVSLVDGSPPLLNFADGRYRYLLADGTLLSPQGFDYASPFASGRAIIRQDGRAYLMDESGRRIADLGATPPVELRDDVRDDADRFFASPLEDGWAGVPTEAGLRAVNPWGLSLEVHDLRTGTEGMVPYQTPSGQWGYLSSDGTGRIEASFAEVGAFAEGLAPVWPPGSGAMYIDRAGIPRIEGPFRAAMPISYGTAIVVFPGEERWSVLSTSGQVLFRDRFKSTILAADGRPVMIEADGDTVMVDARGEITPYRADPAVSRD